MTAQYVCVHRVLEGFVAGAGNCSGLEGSHGRDFMRAMHQSKGARNHMVWRDGLGWGESSGESRGDRPEARAWGRPSGERISNRSGLNGFSSRPTERKSGGS